MGDGPVKTSTDSEGGAKWPEGQGGGALSAPVTAAVLANAAARAAASSSRRDLLEYQRLRRKG